MSEKAVSKYWVAFWALVIGAVVSPIVLTSFFGWKTGGGSEDFAVERVEKVALPLAAEICVTKFKADPEYVKHLEGLKAESSWSRSSYLQKGPWAKVDGLRERDVASKCVGLMEEDLK